jgi:RimJ/RimL family protein N-acetyltransferase
VDVAIGAAASPEVVAFTLPHTGASRRVMEKLGFVCEKTAPCNTLEDDVLSRLMST